nr:hypothetical protein [Tanacetum cinerariifolium]
MPPDRDTQLASYNNAKCNLQNPSRLSMDTLQRTISDISFELSKEVDVVTDHQLNLPTILEVEDAKCECCGMSEECTPEYVARVEALSEHTSVCVRFNRFDRTNPVMFQAAAMKEMLKKSRRLHGNRAKFLSTGDQKRGYGNVYNKGGLTRSSI